MAIPWKRGDTPLLLPPVDMDLTGCTVDVRMRDAYDETAPVYILQSTVTGAEAGQISIASETIAVGHWLLETEVAQGGTVIATFPREGRQILSVSSDLDGSTPLPDEPETILDGGAP